MVDIPSYISALTDLLCQSFGRRLLYIGLQGSYLRGEATETSDIDVMVVLRRMTPADLSAYRRAIEELESNTGKTYEKIYIVGGGTKNKMLNRLTQEATGKQVVALPIEATALGNLKIQMEAR